MLLISTESLQARLMREVGVQPMQTCIYCNSHVNVRRHRFLPYYICLECIGHLDDIECDDPKCPNEGCGQGE